MPDIIVFKINIITITKIAWAIHPLGMAWDLPRTPKVPSLVPSTEEEKKGVCGWGKGTKRESTSLFRKVVKPQRHQHSVVP